MSTMNKEIIEYYVRVQAPIAPDEYGDSIADILTPPSRLHPIRRHKYLKEQPLRIRLVFGQYAKELVNALTVPTGQ